MTKLRLIYLQIFHHKDKKGPILALLLPFQKRQQPPGWSLPGADQHVISHPSNLSTHPALLPKSNPVISSDWNGAGSCGALPRINPFHAPPHPHFLCIGNGLHSSSLTLPEFQEADSNSCLSSKGGNAETKGEKSSTVSADIGKGPGSLLRNIHNTASKLFCRN